MYAASPCHVARGRGFLSFDWDMRRGRECPVHQFEAHLFCGQVRFIRRLVQAREQLMVTANPRAWGDDMILVRAPKKRPSNSDHAFGDTSITVHRFPALHRAAFL